LNQEKLNCEGEAFTTENTDGKDRVIAMIGKEKRKSLPQRTQRNTEENKQYSRGGGGLMTEIAQPHAICNQVAQVHANLG
jgi:hypothetical protein